MSRHQSVVVGLLLAQLRDRILVGAAGNQQLAKMRRIQVQTHDKALQVYEKRMNQAAQTVGQRLPITFDWLKDETNV